MSELEFSASDLRKVIIDIPDDTSVEDIRKYLKLLRSQPNTVSAEAVTIGGNLVIIREFRV